MTFLTLLQRLFALLSLVVLGCGAYLVWTWWDLRQTLETLAPGDEIRLGEWRLYLGCVLIGWSLLGSLPVRLALGRGGGDGARFKRSAGYQVSAPDGSRVYVEQAGPAEAPVLVFVHGWGMDATTWFEARQHLSNRYRLVVWDLPGLGRSKGPSDGRYNLDRFAEALTTVLDLAGRRQVILIGHSRDDHPDLCAPVSGCSGSSGCRRRIRKHDTHQSIENYLAWKLVATSAAGAVDVSRHLASTAGLADELARLSERLDTYRHAPRRLRRSADPRSIGTGIVTGDPEFPGSAGQRQLGDDAVGRDR